MKDGRKNDEKKKEGQKGGRNSGGKEERKKKSLVLALNWSSYFCWVPVCGTGGGVWKDWFHFSPFLNHTLRCCSASSPVAHGPSAPY